MSADEKGVNSPDLGAEHHGRLDEDAAQRLEALCRHARELGYSGSPSALMSNAIRIMSDIVAGRVLVFDAVDRDLDVPMDPRLDERAGERGGGLH